MAKITVATHPLNLPVSILKNYKQLNITIMNENLNLVEILKDCPSGTKLYSPIVGVVELKCIKNNFDYPIDTYCNYMNLTLSFAKDGLYYSDAVDGECMLFPSKDQRDWSKFKPNKPKFDPKTFKPFDKVLAFFDGMWNCDLYSHYSDSKDNICVGVRVRRVIPYNEETKHLIGSTKEAPEYYRYWED